MSWQYTPFTLPLVVTAVVAAGMAVIAWRRRPAPGAGSAAGSLFAIAGWCAGYAAALSSTRYADQLFWANVQYLFICATPTLLLTFALAYTGRGHYLSWRVLLALCVQPALTVFLAFASPSLPLLRTGGTQVTVGGLVLVEWSRGPYFWFHILYSYGLMLAATLILVPVIVRSPHLYRLQMVTVLAGVLTPWLANALYIFHLSPFPHLDLTPFALFVYAAAVAWGLLRLQLFDVVPVARDSIVEGLQEGVVVLGLNGRIADVNPAAERIFGRPARQLVGIEPDGLDAALPTALAAETPTEITRTGPDGVDRVYELLHSSVRDHRRRERGRLLVLHDVTERRLAEQDRLRVQRLRAAGELAAGVAHNLNNILVGILAPARRLQEGGDAGVARQAEVIATAAERARDLVRRLQRGGPDPAAERLEAVDVAAAIADAVEAARPRWQDEAGARGARIEVVTDVAGPGRARADRSELHDALLNLIFNAVDAMPAGGRLSLEAGVDGDAVEIRVGDTGIGMDADTRSRIFEPFFTTKVDVGTGLGLATLYRAVQRWGGSVAVDSEPGQGTTVRLRLAPWTAADEASPADEPEAEEPRAAAEAPTDEPPLQVLIAEDEVVISMVVTDCSRRLGHAVETVDNGDDALERLQRGSIDIAVLDLGIPGQRGDEVARRARALDPGLVLVLMTGWTLEAGDQRLQPFDLSLYKPFDTGQAVEILRRATALHASRERDG